MMGSLYMSDIISKKNYPAARFAMLTASVIVLLFAAGGAVASKKNNAFGQEHFTVETAHFRIYYHRGLDHLVPRVAEKLEFLHGVFSETYNIVLPRKTDVILYESDIPEGFAQANVGMIYLGVHDYDFNLRGNSDWIDDLVTHEYAHVVSLATGLKLPQRIPAVQLGYYSHRNSRSRFEGMHLFSSETAPIWFVEGIAQYEGYRYAAERWDSHRDMVLRTRALSNNLLSWAHMGVFTGRGDDYEMVYNHGFSLVKYISEIYGYEKIAAMLRENSRIARWSFDGSIRAVLGISAKQLYDDWREWLRVRYEEQVRAIGTQVFGRKISRAGYDNLYPAFSPDESKIYFVSNDEHDYYLHNLYSYNMSDTAQDDKRVKFEMPVGSDFDIHRESGRIAYMSMKSPRSFQAPHVGGQRVFDLFVDTLPPERPRFFRRSRERQLTEARSVFAAAFSPRGDEIAIALRKFDRMFLAIIDTSGENIRIVYPHVASADNFFNDRTLPEGTNAESFSTIFSLAWSPNGNDIAVDYIDGNRRSIGIFDTTQKTFRVLFDDGIYDRRHPSYNANGSAIYFASDESGIFNIYRYVFDTGALERLTNVSGGAFHPAVSRDEKKLVYSGYDADGYNIYLIDNLAALSSTIIHTDNALSARWKFEEPGSTVLLSNRQQYSHFPRQMLVVPTLVAEVRDDGSDNYTHSILGGVIVNLLDPLAWSDVGNDIGAYLLVDLARVFNFIDLDRGLISPRAGYDAGAYISSRMFPVTIDAELRVRGISAVDWFNVEGLTVSGSDTLMNEHYRVQLTNALIEVIPNPHWRTLRLSAFAGADRYDVAIEMNEELYGRGVFNYNLSYGYRAGAAASFAMRDRNQRSNISPLGMAGKLQYAFWQQRSLQEENSFSVDGSTLREQYDTYHYHKFDARLFFGMPTPWYAKHDLHLSLVGSHIIPTNDQTIPSFFYPVAHVPGYVFYFEADRHRPERGDTLHNVDTVLVTGQTVLSGELSYRFPIWPGRIDKKLSFIYFDRLFGALNVNAGAGFDDPNAITNWNRADWLLSYGAELRLETITFNHYPLALSFRYDYGADNPDVFGGHRFAFTLGFSFDDWGSVRLVDYFAPARLQNRNSFSPIANFRR